MFKYLKIGEVITLETALLISGGLAGFFFGGWSQMLTILLVIQGLDVFTGVLVGIKDKRVSSTLMRKGLVKKVGIWILIVFTHMLDLLLFQGQMVAQSAVLFAFIAQEGLSLAENLGNIGVIVPPSVTQYLTQVKNKSESDSTDKQ
jgi:toxin secretion/phage lysis holin